MEENNKDGAYIIQEQGDLGLGTTRIDPKYVTEDGMTKDGQVPKDNGIGFKFGENK